MMGCLGNNSYKNQKVISNPYTDTPMAKADGVLSTTTLLNSALIFLKRKSFH